MPNITIYLNDEEYKSFKGLSEEEQKILKDRLKEGLKCQEE